MERGMKRLWNSAGVRFAREMAALFFDKRGPQSAAELAYFLVLTFFPALICVNAIVGLLDLDIQSVVDAASPFLPQEILGVLGDYIGYITTNQSAGLLWAGGLATLFTASAAFRVLMHVMEEIYGRRSYRGLKRLGASLVFTLLFLLTIYLSLVVLLTGGWLFQAAERLLHLPPGLLPWHWRWMRFLLLFSLVLLFVLLVYRMAAPRGRPRPPVVAGALVAAGSLVVASMIFSWVISLFSPYSLVYGSLTSVVVMLVWLYLCGNILIIGNVFNCVWYRWKKARLLRREGRGS